jgi:gliding motility-associated-like protein
MKGPFFIVRFIWGLLICLCAFNHVQGQQKFQKQFHQPDSASSLQTFDAKATPDGGYIMAGLASQGSSNVYHPYLIKLNCKGELQWEHYFGNTQTIANVNTRVIVTADSGYVMISNLGVYTNYNGFAVKLDASGNIVWQKLLNLSNSNDNINDVYETADGHLIIAASIKDFPDVGLVKLRQDGSLVWCRTFGNANQYDDGSVVRELADGNYMIAGRYIAMGTFNAFLMKTDTSGNMLWLKCYGDTLQHMWAMDFREMQNGDIVLGGSTTLLKPNYQSFSDNFLMRVNSNGDTLWTKIFYGANDQFENVSSLILDQDENIIAGVATASYVSPGFVPNKHAVMKFSPQGQLLKATLYNNGSSHYPRISKCLDRGILLSGFSNAYSGPLGFRTLLMKMDSTLSTGCIETDVTNQTFVQSKLFRVNMPVPITGNSGTVVNNSSTYTTSILDSTLCASFPVVQSAFTYSGGCKNEAVQLFADSSGILFWHWEILTDTLFGAQTQYTFTDTGTYQIRLWVSNGCDTASSIQQIVIRDKPDMFVIGSDTTLCEGDSIQLGSTTNADGFLWNTGDTTRFITVTQNGQYIVEADFGVCGVLKDTVSIQFVNCVPEPEPPAVCTMWLPNAFSPNGDGKNDLLKPIVAPTALDLKFTRMEVYNRWGNRLYFSEDISSGWDGKHQGQEQSTDTYFFIIRYKCGDEDRVLKGDVVLVR